MFPFTLPRSFFLLIGILTMAFSATAARPPLFLLDDERLAEIRQLVTQPGTTHHEAFAAMKARVDANDIPGPSSGLRSDFAREAAFVYLVTENTAYAQAAFVRLQEIYSISVPAGQDAPDVGSGLARAQGIASFSSAYNWAYDGWTSEQRAWVWGVLEKALNEYQSEALSHPNIGFQSNNSNWSGVVAGAHVMTLIALDQHNVRRFDFQQSRELLRTHLLSFGSRGWTQEGNYYFVLSMEYLMPAMLALRQINDAHVEPSFAARRPHHITMYAGMFNDLQNSLTWGVGGDTMPPYGMTSALLGLVPEGELGFYKWFYDRHRGIHNPAVPALKYDHRKAGTPFALIAYPQNVPAQNPSGHYPTVIHDNLGGYIFRSGWESEDDTVVSLLADTNNYGRSWNQRDAGQINILSHGAKWGHGPGPATSGLNSSFSQILVNGIARTDTGQGTSLGHQVAPNGGYAMVSGGSKYTNLGLTQAVRHVLADFSPEGYSIVSTFDRLRANEIKTYGWNLYLPDRTVVVGTDMDNDVDYFYVADANGAYLKAWFIVHGNGFITADQAVRYEYDAANADIWVVMAAGRGTPPQITVTGTGLEAVVTLGDSVLTFDAGADRIRSSTLTELNSAVNPILTASTTTGQAPLTVSFSGSGTADPSETLVYSWDFGDGTTSNLQSTSHTFTENGLYLVSLEVADGRGGSDRVVRQIFVGNREPTANISASQTIVLPGTLVTLSGSGSIDPEGGTLTYEWNLADGRIMTGESIEVSWPVEGNYSVQLKVTDSAGLISVARLMIRVQNQSPVASFSASSLGGFVPLTINFDASSSYDPEGEALLYRWDFNDGTVIETAQSTISHQFTQSKKHTVRLTVFDPAGKSGTTTRLIDAIGAGSILPAIADLGEVAQGLNYRVYQGDASSEAALPEISSLRPLNGGRVQHYDHDITTLNQLYVIVFDGYLYAPETGVYSFYLRTQQQSRVRVGGLSIVQSNTPHSGTYEGLIALEAGFHRYRIETNYAPVDPGGTRPTLSVLWSPPGTDVHQPIPDDHLFSPVALFQPTFIATPNTVYDGGTMMFESTVVSPDGGPLSYFWEFGDGNTSTSSAVAHTYNLSSNDAHRVYNVKLTVTDSTGNAVTVGEQVTVSRYAGLVMPPRTQIGRNTYNFDKRVTPRDPLQAVNHALEPGAVFTFSSQLRSDLGAANINDNNYQTRWVSAQPQDWVRYSFTGSDGAPKRYNITEYSLTAGALGWTTHRDPLEWEVYGSNVADPEPFSMEAGASNPSWTLISSVTGQKGVGRIIPTIYSLPNTEAYAHYLFHFRNQSGGLEAELELTEVQIFSYFEHDSSIDGNQPPVPSLAVSLNEVDGPIAIEFDASATFDPDGDWLYYSWDFGDGHIEHLQLEKKSVSHTYYRVGTYQATLTVTDARGASAQTSEVITVLPSPPNNSPVAQATVSAQTVLVGTSITFDSTATFDPDGDAMHFRWEFGNGVNAEGEVVTHTYYKPGIYNPVLMVTDERGQTGFHILTIEVLPPNGGRGVLSFNFNRGIGRLNPNRGAGVVSVAYWNDLFQPRVPGIYDSRGQPVDLQITSTGRQSSFGSIYPVSRFDGNAQLGRTSEGKTTYGADEGFTWTIENIPYDVYDVYLYFGGSAESTARTIYVNGEPRYARKQGHGYTGAWQISEATIAAEAKPGDDLLIWRNVIGSSILIEKLTRSSDAISGFQIIDKTGSPDAPPIVAIQSPVQGDWFTQGDTVIFSGSAMMGEITLDEPFLRWESSIDGFLGNGVSIAVSTLSVGTHTISFTGTNEGNLSMTDVIDIVVFPMPAPPTIVTEPVDITTYETATIELTVVAEGSPPLFTYQWWKNGEPLENRVGLSGANAATLTLSGVSFQDVGAYEVVVTNAEGFTTSRSAQLIVTELVAPAIGAAPVGGIVDAGSVLTLTANISGSRPMQFRWHLNGDPLENDDRISGADTETLIIQGVIPGDSGNYELVATNAGGTITTDIVNIVVNLPPHITVIRPVGAMAEIPLGTGAWLRTELADNTVDVAELLLSWEQVSGPEGVEFTHPFAAETGVHFSAIGEYVVRLVASDGSLSSDRTIALTVRDDLENVSAPVGPPMLNDFFDWGTANRTNQQLPAGSGWRFGTNNFSYLGGRSAIWSGTGENPYVLFGHPTQGGLLRGSVQHNPRGVQRDLPAIATGQRWVSVLVWLHSGWDNNEQTAVFSLGNDPSYSASSIRGQGFGFRHDGTSLRLAALDRALPVAVVDTITPQQKWLLILAKTVVNPSGPDSISIWSFDADSNFGLTESSLGEPHLSYDGFDWGTGYNNIWIGAYRPNGPTAVFEFDELRVSSEGGDRGLGQVLADIDSGIQIGPEVSILSPGFVDSGIAVDISANVNDPDSHPDPFSVIWSTVSGPAQVDFTNVFSQSIQGIFPMAGTYLLRLIADDGAVSTFGDITVVADGQTSDAFAAWMSSYSADIAENMRGPDDDASGDGISNLEVYARGLDPRIATSGENRSVARLSQEGEILVLGLQIPQGLNRPDLHYRISKSTDLETWSTVAEAIGSTHFTVVADAPAPTLLRNGDIVELRFSSVQTFRFFRLEIQLID